VRTAIAPPRTVVVLDDGPSCPQLPLVDGSGRARAVVWPGVGAYKRSLHRFSLAAGARTVAQDHPSEAVYYVMSGGGVVRDPDAGTADPVDPGAMVHVTPGTGYVFEAGPSGLELVGGPCPADERLYAHLATAAD
jgi:quercetin dioxygenase-like cupin family protein